MLTRKLALVGAIGTVLALGLAGCSSGGSGGGSTGGASGGPSGDPIVLAGLGPLTGTLSAVGTDIQRGAEIAAKQINAKGGVLGRPLQVQMKDSAGGAQAATQIVRDYINAGNPLIFGEVSSANCLAFAPVVDQLDGVYIAGACTNEGLTGENGQPAPFARTFRVGATSIQDMIALTDTIVKKFPDVSTYDAFAFDYVSGHLQWQQFQDEAQKQGKPITPGQVFFVPLDAQDYGSQISVLAQSSKEGANRGLYLGTYSSATASFFQQSAPYDYLKNYKVVVNPGGYYPIARDLNGSAPEVWNGYDYNWSAYDSDMNKQFVDDFQAAYGYKPDTWAYQTYLAGLAYAAAIEKAGSADADAVAQALAGISFDSPQGEFTIDPVTHKGNANIVITDTVGDPNDPEKLKILSLTVVPYADAQ